MMKFDRLHREKNSIVIVTVATTNNAIVPMPWTMIHCRMDRRCFSVRSVTNDVFPSIRSIDISSIIISMIINHCSTNRFDRRRWRSPITNASIRSIHWNVFNVILWLDGRPNYRNMPFLIPILDPSNALSVLCPTNGDGVRYFHFRQCQIFLVCLKDLAKHWDRAHGLVKKGIPLLNPYKKRERALLKKSIEEEDQSESPLISDSDEHSASMVPTLLKKGERTYQCRWCDFRGRWQSEVLQHMRYHHAREKPYRCSDCSYGSSWKWDVQVMPLTFTDLWGKNFDFSRLEAHATASSEKWRKSDRVVRRLSLWRRRKTQWRSNVSLRTMPIQQCLDQWLPSTFACSFVGVSVSVLSVSISIKMEKWSEKTYERRESSRTDFNRKESRDNGNRCRWRGGRKQSK